MLTEEALVLLASHVRLVSRTLPTSRPVGLTGFPALLLDRRLASPQDLSVADRHAAREHMDLADALIALGSVTSSELAIRVVPERLARRHFGVRLEVE